MLNKLYLFFKIYKMSKSPIVSVICSCYNHSDYVIESLESVLNQSYTNIELIIVDDCSGDDSVQVINNWLVDHSKVKFIQNPINLGLTKSFNRAVRTSKGDYLIDLAADDLLLTNAVESLVNIYFKTDDSELALVFGNASNIDKNGKVLSDIFNSTMISKVYKAVEKGYYKYLLKDSDYMCSVSGMYNRSIFEEICGYDEDLCFEDFDYWLRVSKSYKIVFSEKILVHKRLLEDSLSSGFAIRNNYTQKLQKSFYVILLRAYDSNLSKVEYLSLLIRIYGQIKWSIKNMNFTYVYLYVIFFFKVIFKILF